MLQNAPPTSIISLVDSRLVVDNRGLLQQRHHLLDKRRMHGIFLDVVIAVLLAFELDDKCMRRAVLEVVSQCSTENVSDFGAPTCRPSTLLSMPPLDALMYGCLVVWRTQLSLRPSILVAYYVQSAFVPRVNPTRARKGRDVLSDVFALLRSHLLLEVKEDDVYNGRHLALRFEWFFLGGLQASSCWQ